MRDIHDNVREGGYQSTLSQTYMQMCASMLMANSQTNAIMNYRAIHDRSRERFRPYEVIPNGRGSHRVAEQRTFLCKVLESELALNKFERGAPMSFIGADQHLKACCTETTVL